VRENLLVKPSRRHFQQYGRSYMTGFDRMLGDKLSHFRVNGHWFALFGVANILAYGAHLFMDN
jgi:hypothetical protein